MGGGIDPAGETGGNREPASTQLAARSRAKRRPFAEALRAPTTAIMGRRSNSAWPSTVRIGGASSIAASALG